MTADAAKLLIIGFGNPGRLDDGLGPAFAAAMEAKMLPGVTVDSDYQLTVEDAVIVADHPVVLFADADVAGAEPFYIRSAEPAADSMTFSTHHVSIEGVLALTRDMFNATPEAYVIGIRGYEFNEFGEWLSPKAQANLDAAIEHVTAAIESGTIGTVRADEACPATGQGNA